MGRKLGKIEILEKIKASKKWLQAARAAPSDASHGADRPPAVTTMTRGDGRGASGAEGPNVAGDSTSGVVSQLRNFNIQCKKLTGHTVW